MRREEKTRVTVDFPRNEHRRLKAVAALSGVSMQQYIIGCVEEKLYSENIPNAKTRKVFKKTDEDAKLKELSFKNAYIVFYQEGVTVSNDNPMTVKFTLSAEIITLGNAEHDNRWPKA